MEWFLNLISHLFCFQVSQPLFEILLFPGSHSCSKSSCDQLPKICIAPVWKEPAHSWSPQVFVCPLKKNNPTNTKQAPKITVPCWSWGTATLLWALQCFFIVPVQHLPVLRWGVICHSHLCYPSFSLSLTLLSLLSSVLFALSSYFQQLLVGEWPLTFSACSLLSPLFLGSLLLSCNVFLCCFCAAANQNNNNKNYLPTNLPWKYLLAALCALTSFHWSSASWHEWHLIVTEHLPDSVHSVFLMFLPAHKCCKLFNIKHKLAEGKCCCFIIYCSFFCCPAYG